MLSDIENLLFEFRLRLRPRLAEYRWLEQEVLLLRATYRQFLFFYTSPIGDAGNRNSCYFGTSRKLMLLNTSHLSPFKYALLLTSRKGNLVLQSPALAT